MASPTRIGVPAAAAVTLALLVLAACAGSTTGSTTGASGSTPVATGTPGSPSGAAAAQYNMADVAFAQMMIVHHQGAIQMAELAADRAQSQQVTDLAARIKAAQTPEIEQMTAWLAAWGMPAMTTGMSRAMPGDTGTLPGGTSGTGHGDMGGDMGGSAGAASSAVPGMMSGEQLQQLQSASGAAFDSLFLRLMIAHHQGAIEMADTELSSGSNPEAQALAAKIKSDQTAEIAEMKDLLATG